MIFVPHRKFFWADNRDLISSTATSLTPARAASRLPHSRETSTTCIFRITHPSWYVKSNLVTAQHPPPPPPKPPRPAKLPPHRRSEPPRTKKLSTATPTRAASRLPHSRETSPTCIFRITHPTWYVKSNLVTAQHPPPPPPANPSRPTNFARSRSSSACSKSTLAPAIPTRPAGSGSPTSCATPTRAWSATRRCWRS